MRELTINELCVVSGAGGGIDGLADHAKNISTGSALGTGVAISRGVAIATGAGAGAALGASFSVGYAGGQWLNNNTPIQSWITKGLDNMAGDNYSDGCDY